MFTFTPQFFFMQPITVSKALAIIQKRIKIAAVIMIVGWGLSMFTVIQLNVVFHWVFVGVFFLLVIFLLVRSYLIVKWKIWAFEHVNNLPDLIEKAQANGVRIIRSDIIPDKWTICSEADRQKIIEIVRRRLNSNTTVVDLVDNNTIPHTFKIEDGKKNNLMIAAACFCMLYMPFSRLYSETSKHPENDYAFVTVLLLAGFYFLYKIISPSVIVSLSSSGIWTKKSNFQKWKAVESIYLDYEIDHQGQRLHYLIIVFNALSGMETKNLTQKFNVVDLNKDANEIEYAISIYKQRVAKSGQILADHNFSKKTVSDSDAAKENPLWLLLIPFIILLIGSFLMYRTERPKEEYYVLKGKITYLENTIGSYKARGNKYIQIENNPTIFDIFIGKESGDFSPKLDKTDELKLNDEVTIYYSSTSTQKQFSEIPLNNSIQFIEKENKLYFHEGTKNKIAAYIVLTAGVLFLIIISIVILRKKYFKQA